MSICFWASEDGWDRSLFELFPDFRHSADLADAIVTGFGKEPAEGNRVAATISVNLFFGTGYMAPKTGVLLNNTMDDFSTKPGRPNEFGLVGATANAIAPNKRG